MDGVDGKWGVDGGMGGGWWDGGWMVGWKKGLKMGGGWWDGKKDGKWGVDGGMKEKMEKKGGGVGVDEKKRWMVE